MALFTTDLNRTLYSWCLPQVALSIPTMKCAVVSHNMPKTKENMQLSPYNRIPMFQKLRSHLWKVVRIIIHHCVGFTVHLNSSMLLMCAREMVAMTGKSKKSTLGLEAQGGSGQEVWTRETTPDTMVKKLLEPQTKTMEDPVDVTVTKLALEGHEKVMLPYWLESDVSEEEEEDDDDDDNSEDEDKDLQNQEEEEEEEEEQEEDSDWSEEDSDWSDEDSEVSTESTELWESFLNTSDPYNPLYFSSSTGVKTKTLDARESQPALSPTASEIERPASTHSPEWNTKEGAKKVRFSEEVKVRHLVAWTFASRAARDGSCWLELARDRDRFRRRVEKTGEVISPCLTAEHRARVWERLYIGSQPSEGISV